MHYKFAAAIIPFMSMLACTVMEAPTDLMSLAVPEREPESEITCLSHLHIMTGVTAWWGCFDDIQKRVSDWCLSLTKLLRTKKTLLLIKLINFKCELLGSQTSHRNESVLFKNVRARRFQKVQAHLCGMSVSRAIRGWNWSILAKFIENLKSTKMAKWEIDEIF